jgi:hypothetical protein
MSGAMKNLVGELLRLGLVGLVAFVVENWGVCDGNHALVLEGIDVRILVHI